MKDIYLTLYIEINDSDFLFFGTQRISKVSNHRPYKNWSLVIRPERLSIQNANSRKVDENQKDIFQEKGYIAMGWGKNVKFVEVSTRSTLIMFYKERL